MTETSTWGQAERPEWPEGVAFETVMFDMDGQPLTPEAEYLDAWELYAQRLEGLLRLAHNDMDDINASEDAEGECRFCDVPPPYDGNGLRHADDCTLVRIRALHLSGLSR